MTVGRTRRKVDFLVVLVLIHSISCIQSVYFTPRYSVAGPLPQQLICAQTPTPPHRSGKQPSNKHLEHEMAQQQLNQERKRKQPPGGICSDVGGGGGGGDAGEESLKTQVDSWCILFGLVLHVMSTNQGNCCICIYPSHIS